MAQENIVVNLIDASLEPGDIYVSNAILDVNSVLHLQRENAPEITVDFHPMMEMYDDIHVSSGIFSNRTKQFTLKFNNSNVSDVTIDLSSLTLEEFGGKNYDPLHTYNIGDIVSTPNGNKIYIAVTDPQTGSPGTANSGWANASTTGTKGDKGDQGIQGPPGPDGPAGSGVYIRGSDTVVNILNKPFTYGDMWLAEDTGTDDIGAAVLPGDGLISGTDKWISVGPVRGPQGIQGIAGNDGSNGIDGTDGTDGQQGLTGPEGPEGPGGEDGDTILNGLVNPTGSIGDDGDFYINTSTHYMFGPRVSGVWGIGTKIIGEDGPEGPPGADGEGIPDGGNINDVLSRGAGDSTVWKSPLSQASVGKNTTGTTSICDFIWAGTTSEYEALAFYDPSILYVVK